MSNSPIGCYFRNFFFPNVGKDNFLQAGIMSLIIPIMGSEDDIFFWSEEDEKRSSKQELPYTPTLSTNRSSLFQEPQFLSIASLETRLGKSHQEISAMIKERHISNYLFSSASVRFYNPETTHFAKMPPNICSHDLCCEKECHCNPMVTYITKQFFDTLCLVLADYDFYQTDPMPSFALSTITPIHSQTKITALSFL